MFTDPTLGTKLLLCTLIARLSGPARWAQVAEGTHVCSRMVPGEPPEEQWTVNTEARRLTLIRGL